MNGNCFCSFITCFALTEMFYRCGKNKHRTVVYPLAWEHAQATHLRHVLLSVPQHPFHISWSRLNRHQGHSGNCGCRFMLRPLTLFTPWPPTKGHHPRTPVGSPWNPALQDWEKSSVPPMSTCENIPERLLTSTLFSFCIIMFCVLDYKSSYWQRGCWLERW